MNRLNLQELNQHFKQTPYGYLWGKEEIPSDWSLERMCVVDMGLADPASDPWENSKAHWRGNGKASGLGCVWILTMWVEDIHHSILSMDV